MQCEGSVLKGLHSELSLSKSPKISSLQMTYLFPLPPINIKNLEVLLKMYFPFKFRIVKCCFLDFVVFFFPPILMTVLLRIIKNSRMLVINLQQAFLLKCFFKPLDAADVHTLNSFTKTNKFIFEHQLVRSQ